MIWKMESVSILLALWPYKHIETFDLFFDEYN